jgi:hypothetical protein
MAGSGILGNEGAIGLLAGEDTKLLMNQSNRKFLIPPDLLSISDSRRLTLPDFLSCPTVTDPPTHSR